MRRSVKYGANALLFTVMVTAIVVLVNLFSIKYHTKLDLTPLELFSLSGQSIKTLKTLPEKIKAIAFAKPDSSETATDLLEQYAYESDKFSFEVIDPDSEPVIAKKYNVSVYDTIVVESESGRVEVASRISEESVTNAILKATTSDVDKIYILTGHDERSVDGDGSQSWSGAVARLKSAGYEVATLNWFETGEIPDDCNLLIIPGPRNDFQDGEIKQLEQYLAKGRSLFISIDPGHYPKLEGLMERYGVIFDDNTILDPVSENLGLDAAVATLATYGDHDIVKAFRAASFFPVARSLTLRNDSAVKTEHHILGSTAFESWGETDITSIEKRNPVFDEERDFPGPLILMAAVTWGIGNADKDAPIGGKIKKGRMIVAGDTDFASNATLQLSRNADLFLNSIGWLLTQERRISIRAKTKGFNPILFEANELTLIFWVLVIVMPGVAVVAGVLIYSWRKRR